jgi:hypothetical protein
VGRERINKIKAKKKQPDVVAHACNPSYSGCSYQEDHGSKPALDK